MMSKIYFFIVILALFLTILISNFYFSKKELVRYKIDDKTYFLKIAKTPEDWRRGLMFIRKPVNFDGMIFIFPDKQIRTFWNKNTFIDLDIYWLDDNKIIGKDFLPSIEKTKEIYTITSPEPVNKVIEIIK